MFAVLGIGFILWLDSWFMNHVEMPKLSLDISYGLLLLIGFLTSFHCVGMCAPLFWVIPQKMLVEAIRPTHRMYFMALAKPFHNR